TGSLYIEVACALLDYARGFALTQSSMQLGKRIALVSILVSALLSVGIGWFAGSTSVIADGLESASDVLASGLVVDIISAAVAMTALGMTLWDPSRFPAADHYGGFAVGVIVVFTGVRVAQDTTARLSDAMPDSGLIDQSREIALAVPGVSGVEKLFARNTGLQYHVDLHLEVDPEM